MTNIDPAAISPEDIDDLDVASPVTAESTSFDRAGVRDSVRKDLDHARAKARAKALDAEAAIRENPIQSTAWALVAGVLLGVILTR